MKNTQRQYADHDVIFREADASTCVFVIVEGRVKLSKADAKGEVHLAVLGPGEMFGEMGVLSNGKRSATAEADGDIVVAVISRQDFIDGLATDPALAMSVMNRLAKRLQGADNLVLRGAKRVKGKKKRGSGRGLLDWLLGRRRGGAKRPRPRRLDVRVSNLAGPAGAAETPPVVLALGRGKGFRTRRLKKILSPDAGLVLGGTLTTAVSTARAWLTKEGADLLVWGEAPDTDPTITLRFVSAVGEDMDRPGDFDPSLPLYLPMGFGDELAPVLAAIAMAAATPDEEGKSMGRLKALNQALEAALPVMRELPDDLTAAERSTLLLCCGNVLATAAVLMGTTEYHQMAAHLYRLSLEGLTAAHLEVPRAIALKQLGAVMQALNDITGDDDALESAADSYNAALKILTLDETPREWATAQSRLGVVLFKLYLKENDIELLKRALAAFQDSLQVFSRATTPFRWAEIMNHFAQAAQHLGEQLQNSEVLEKAGDACRIALEVRTRQAAPHLWAATQSNLGSALFFLGKLTGDTDHLLASAYALGLAHDFYMDSGAEKLAAVQRKNLAKVEPLLDKRAPELPKMAWEEETG